MQTAAGGSLQLTSEEQKYLEWSKMTPEQKREYRTNRAKSHLQSGPNITNFWEAFQTYIGNRDPKNPHLQTGEAPNPGMRNPKDIIRLFRATGTSGKFKPSLDGTPEFTGQWFTDNIRKPLRYASSTFKKAKISKESNPIELQVVEIPASEINKYKASELLKGRTDIEYEPTEDFLIPLNYPRQKYPIEGLTGNLLQDMRLKLPIEKQGGKMNIIEKFKKGSGIHIKKENRGKFTDYCGGKVTSECIAKGKNSSNPVIRKRATFAANARKWKHKSGGQIVKEFKIRQKFQQGGSVDWGSIASNVLNAGVQTYSANKQIDAQTKLSNADLDKKYSQMIQSLQEMNREKQKEYWMNWVNNVKNGQTLENMSPEVLKHFGQNQIGWQMGNAKDETSKQKRANDDAATSQKTANYVQLFGSVANTALNAFGQYMANRQKNTPTVQQTPVTQQLNTTPQSNIQFNNPSLNDTLYQANNYNFV